MTDIFETPDKRAPVFLFSFSYNGQYYRYTDSPDQDEQAMGVTFLRKVITLTELAASVTEDVDDVTVTLPSDDNVVQIFDALLPVEPVRCTIYSFEVNDPNRVVRVRKTGEVGAIVMKDDGTTEITIKPIGRGMNLAIPNQLQQATCTVVHYGPQCRLNPEAYRTRANGLIDLQPGFVQAAEFASTDPTYYKAGWLRCSRTGELRFVLDQQPNGVLVISYPFNFARVTDAFDAWAGCMRTDKICAEKFDNIENSLLFQKIPTKNIWTSGIKG